MDSNKFPWPYAAILVMCMTIATASYHTDICFDNSTNMHLLLDLFQGYAPLISYLVIILEGLNNRKHLSKIWKLHRDVLDIFERELKVPLFLEFRRLLRWFVLLAVTIQFIFLVIEYTIITGVVKKKVWFYNRLVCLPGYIGCRAYLVYYILHVQIFRFLMRCILEYQTRINFALQHRVLREKQTEMQLHVRRAYNKVVRINGLVNECFKYSLTVNFVTNVVCVAVSWIWNYISIRFGTTFALGECR